MYVAPGSLGAAPARKRLVGEPAAIGDVDMPESHVACEGGITLHMLTATGQGIRIVYVVGPPV